MGRRELKAVMALWAVVLGAALAALVALNMNASRLINHLEYVKAGRFARTLALYEEGKKYAEAVTAKGDQLNKNSEKRVLVPASDPDYRRAVELYGRAFALDPRDPYSPDMRKYYEILGQVYGAVGADREVAKMGARGFLCARDYPNAEAYAGTVVARDPKDFEGWMLLADSQLRNQNLAGIDLTISRMETAGAPSDFVHELRGLVAETRGDSKTAVTEYRAALSQKPDNIDLRKRLSALFSRERRIDDAIKVLEEGVDKGGSLDGNYMHLLGLAFLERGKAQEAANALETATAVEARSGDLFFNLAQAYQRLGKDGKANEALQQALRLKPELRNKVLGE